MVGNLKHQSMLVGVVAATTFCTAVAAVVGIVPRVEDTTSVRTAAAAELAPSDRESQTVQDVAPPVIVPTTVGTVVPVVTPETTVAPKTTTAPRQVVAEPEPAQRGADPVVEEVAPVVASAPALPARRVPSPAEVQQAIRGMEKYVTFKSGLIGLLVDVPTPTAKQINKLGDKVCTAFDEGQTLEQVKATGLAMAADNPWVTISGAGPDYVVSTGVTLYCPGHADKLD